MKPGILLGLGLGFAFGFLTSTIMLQYAAEYTVKKHPSITLKTYYFGKGIKK
jgi:hypothetical protein